MILYQKQHLPPFLLSLTELHPPSFLFWAPRNSDWLQSRQSFRLQARHTIWEMSNQWCLVMKCPVHWYSEPSEQHGSAPLPVVRLLLPACLPLHSPPSAVSLCAWQRLPGLSTSSSFCCSLTILGAFLHPAQYSLRTFFSLSLLLHCILSLFTSAVFIFYSLSPLLLLFLLFSCSNKWSAVGKNSVRHMSKTATNFCWVFEKASKDTLLNDSADAKQRVRSANIKDVPVWWMRFVFAHCLVTVWRSSNACSLHHSHSHSFIHFRFSAKLERERERERESVEARSTSRTAVSSLQSIMIGDVQQVVPVLSLCHSLCLAYSTSFRMVSVTASNTVSFFCFRFSLHNRRLGGKKGRQRGWRMSPPPPHHHGILVLQTSSSETACVCVVFPLSWTCLSLSPLFTVKQQQCRNDNFRECATSICLPDMYRFVCLVKPLVSETNTAFNDDCILRLPINLSSSSAATATATATATAYSLLHYHFCMPCRSIRQTRLDTHTANSPLVLTAVCTCPTDTFVCWGSAFNLDLNDFRAWCAM